MRASCFHRIIDNYSALLREWIVCLHQKLEADVRGRIIGCQAQMNTFDFFFGLHLGERLFLHTDKISKTLQKTKMSAVSGQRVDKLTKQVLKKMRNNECFKSFYDTVVTKSKKHPFTSEPALPRQKRAPSRFEIGAGPPSYPTTPQEHYRRIYFEAIGLMVNPIDNRFDQASFKVYAKMESLLVKCLNCKDYLTDLHFLGTNYGQDFDVTTLNVQLEIFKVLIKDGEFTCEILARIRQLSEAEKGMISDIITLCKLLLVNPATSAAGERSFSSARRLKTWLRSTMIQTRFSNLTILNTHKQRTDKLCLIDVATEFAALNENRESKLGTFEGSDSKMSG